MTDKIWANSGDSHLVEPPDLFDSLPEEIRDRMPRTVKDPSGTFETVYVDGDSFQRPLPKPESLKRIMARPEDADDDPVTRAPGANDPLLRLADLDQEGIWGEVIYPSLGIWAFSIRTPRVVREGVRVLNDWAIDFQRHSPRYVCAASVPLLDVEDAVAEIRRAAGLGFHVGFLPTRPPFERPPWQHEEWDPLWDAFADTGMVIGFHIGTEPHTPDQRTGVYHRGRGGAVLNYVETTYGGQRCVTQLIACGALDRHPDLRVLVSEGGATWGPFIADRMDEGYRQHGAAVRPKLSKAPSRYLYEQVYASFQHDRSAVQACAAMGWQNVMWGSDYPHYEGTYGHTQKTLHELFDDVAPDIRQRITLGAFKELFPHVPDPPA
ncbi:MAG TPA: amidohydrolase family protein [Acidimicrobiales bacterium]|nr:amidohydrolase family protein [Acidimicrobiales bacterium]